MSYEREPLSPAALADEPEHRAALQKYADELRAMEPPPRSPAPQPKYVTQAELQRALGGLSESIGRAVRKMVVEPLQKRIAELEAREWLGVWQQGKSYAKNSIVSHDGSAWVAMREFPEGKPGVGNSGWKLIVKRGRDGKDAK